MMFLAIAGIDPNNMSIGETLMIALVCITIVFSMLALLWGIVALFKFIPQPKVVEKPAPAPVFNKPALKMAEIKDEDMMVAALVASMEYHDEIKQDVRVVSIKEL